MIILFRDFFSASFRLSSFIQVLVSNTFLSRLVFSFLPLQQSSSFKFHILYSLMSSFIYICVILVYRTCIFLPSYPDSFIFFYLQSSWNSEIVPSNFPQFLLCSVSWILVSAEWINADDLSKKQWSCQSSFFPSKLHMTENKSQQQKLFPNIYMSFSSLEFLLGSS